MDTPKAPGLDTDLGHRCSRTAFAWAARTFSHREGRWGSVVSDVPGSFCNLVSYGNVSIGITSDGIGTKVEIAERTGVYETLGHDLVAMVTDDLVANGVEPANLSNILDVDRLDHEIVERLMRGLYEAARMARVSVTGGEIAELGQRIGGYGQGMHFNWCATAVGFLPDGRVPITGTAVRPDDRIIALYSPGFRSNGFSLARRILSAKFGDDWHRVPFQEDETWGQALLTPSVIYAPVIVDLLATGIPIHGMVHVTGGGVPDNLGRILRPNGLGARLTDLFPAHPAILRLQEYGDLDEKDAYRQWNMANGFLVVVPCEKEQESVEWLTGQGVEARLAGVVTDSPPIVIESHGRCPKTLTYEKTGK